MAKYYASVYPDNLGNGEYDGAGTYPLGIECGEYYNNNRCWLVTFIKKVCWGKLFSKYPVIVNISEHKSGKCLERWRLKEAGGNWERIYDNRAPYKLGGNDPILSDVRVVSL